LKRITFLAHWFFVEEISTQSIFHHLQNDAAYYRNKIVPLRPQ